MTVDSRSEPGLPDLLEDAGMPPPRRNGELVFDAPWESRAFGMAMMLHEQGRFPWRDFSAALAREIARSDTHPAGTVFPVAADAEARYYTHWMGALESLLLSTGLLSGAEIEARTHEFAQGLWDEH
jgi:nitrile hydratase accessory protein